MEEKEQVVAEERVSIDRVYLSIDSSLKNIMKLNKESDLFSNTEVKGMICPLNERTVNKHDDMISFDNEINLFSAIEVIPSEFHTATCNDKSVINSEDVERNVLDTNMVFKGGQGNLMENIEWLQAFESVCIADIHGEVDGRDGQNMSKNFIEKMESQFVNDSSFQVTGSDLTLPKDSRKPVGITDEETVDETEFTQPGYLCCVSSRKSTFLLDSGAEYHLCRDRFCLHNFKKLPRNEFVELCSADNKAFTAKHKGDIIYHNIKLTVAKLDKEGLMIWIGGGRFTVYCIEQARLVGEGYLNRKNNDYEFKSLDWCECKEDGNQKALIDEEDVPEDTDNEEWIIDCCCSRHMVGKLTMLSEGVPESRKFSTATGTIQTTMSGTVSTGSIFLTEVSHCPDINHNLMSVPQLDTMGFCFTFYNGRCLIQSRETLEEKGYGNLNLKNNRYLLKDFTDTNKPATKTKTTSPRTGGTESKKRKR